MNSIFRYPGAKTRLLPVLRDHLDRMIARATGSFCDVFVGGGSVLLDVAERHPKIKLVANDLDDLMSSFWQVVASSAEGECAELVDRIKKCIPTIEIFDSLRSTEPTDIIDRAFRAVFFNRTTFSGILSAGPIGGKDQTSKWKVGCRYNAEKLGTQINEISKKLRGRLEVFKLPFQEMIAKCNERGSAMYLDPPYFEKGDECYMVSMSDVEHLDLADLLWMTSCPWLLSYDNAPEIRKIYGGWCDVMEISARYSISGQDRKNWVGKRELLIEISSGTD